MHDRGRGRLGHVLAEPGAHRLHRGDLAGAVDLPQTQEAADLALEVAGGATESLQPHGHPVHRVHLDQRVDQLVGHPGPLRGRVEVRRQRVGHHVPVHPLHEVEGRADHRLVGAHPQHPGDPGVAVQGRQHAGLAQDVVGAGRERRPGRAAQDQLAVAPAQEVGDVGVALAHGLDLEAALAHPEGLAVEELLQRVEHEQGRA